MQERGRQPRQGEHADPYRLVVDSIRDLAIFMLDPDGRIVTWNGGSRRIYGLSNDEAVGQHIAMLYAAGDRERCAADLDLARRLGRIEQEAWRVRKDGSRFWANVVTTTMHDPQGAFVGFAKVTRDLSEGRAVEAALRESDERFRLLVDTVADYAIFLLDPRGNVATWNKGAERIKGYRADEIVGQHFSRFYPEEDVRAGKCEFELLRAVADGRFEDEGWRIRKDGSRFWANVVITRLTRPNGDLVGFAKVTRDLTERRRAEEERVRLAQAEEAVRLRDEFLSIASHELRTPLTSLDLQVQSLLERVSVLDTKTRDRVQGIARSTARISTLVDTLLDVSRIATGRLELVRGDADMVEIARETIDRLGELARQARCTVTLNAPQPVIGHWDAMRVEQVISNLLVNAFKYAPGAPVVVDVSREADACVVRVVDRGPGVSPGDAERIFGRFERASSIRHYGGLGLGLYVAREIVEAHGGTIRASPAEGVGASFVVRLPLTGGKPQENKGSCATA